MSERDAKQPVVCHRCGGTKTGTKDTGLSMCFQCGVFWGWRAAEAEQQSELDTLDYLADALDDAGDSQGCMEAAAKAKAIRLRMEDR